MAIKHSPAALALKDYFASFEPKLVVFPQVEKPVYAHPLTASQLDKLDAAYGGFDETGREKSPRVYDVRLMMLALHYEDKTKVFEETDAHVLLAGDPALIQRTALQIHAHITTSFQAVKNS